MDAIKNTIESIIGIGIWLFIISLPFLIILAYGCLAITILTFIISLFTKMNYDEILNRSKILYNINQIGKWTGAVSAVFIIGIIFLTIILI